ncbi:MAG: hypothetical protein AB1324_03845 [Candidatus Micrarchaeota archaeon]
MRGAILSLLVVSLLLFGCGGQQPSNQTNMTGPAPQGGTTAPATGGETGAPGEGQGGTMEEEPEAPPSGGDNAPAQPSGNGYAGMEYAALVALGVPLECDVTTTSNGTTVTSRLYMKDSSTLRVESPTQNAQGCQEMVVIMKNNEKKMYMGCPDGQFMPGCDWLVFTLEGNGTMQGQVSTTGGTEVDTDFSDIPPSDLDCRAWVYDASKFDTGGKVCDLSSMGNYGNYEEYD